VVARRPSPPFVCGVIVSSQLRFHSPHHPTEVTREDPPMVRSGEGDSDIYLLKVLRGVAVVDEAQESKWNAPER
jgi:hypothetical protein